MAATIHDLARAQAAASMKSAELAFLLERSESAPASQQGTVAQAIKRTNRELEELTQEAESIESALKASRESRKAVNRQVDLADTVSSTSWGSGDDERPGAVRAIKSAQTLGEFYGGTTSVSLDDYLRAGFSGDWSHIPDELARGQKSMGTDALGDLVLPTPLANRVIDLSRSASRVIQAGASTVRMRDGTLTFARLTQDPVPAWKNENALIAESDAEFEPVTLTARTLAARVTLSVELAEDSPTIGNAIEAALTAALGSELDRTALLGTGTPPEPRGLLNTSGVLTIDTSAGLPSDYSDFSLAVQRIREANLEPNATILGADVIGHLERLTNSLGDPLTPPESYRDLRKLVTTRLAGKAAVGDWSQFVVGMRQDLRIEASRQANDEDGKGFSSYSVLVRATLRADFSVLKPAAFVVLTDFASAGS